MGPLGLASAQTLDIDHVTKVMLLPQRNHCISKQQTTKNKQVANSNHRKPVSNADRSQIDQNRATYDVIDMQTVCNGLGI